MAAARRRLGGVAALMSLAVRVGALSRRSCPDSSAWHRQDWAEGTNCSVVTFAGSATGDTPLSNPLWVDGLRMYANFTNEQGGLRLGPGNIGYVEVQISSPEADLKSHYRSLCASSDVDVLLAPIASDVATTVLADLKSCGCHKPFIATDTSDSLFQVDADTLWSVQGWNVTRNGGMAIDFLHSLGARTYVILLKARPEYEAIGAALSSAILSEHAGDSQLLASNRWHNGVSEINEIAIGLEAKQPDVFLAVGDLDMFEALLDDFKGQKYAPKAAVFMDGLAASSTMQQDSYTTPGCKRCLVYNQWMGTVPWSEEMRYGGHNNWTVYGDPYGDYSNGIDRRDQRYMGSASNFGTFARKWLKDAHSDVSEPDTYHAKAFASMLLLQMAVELAPGTEGRGLTREQIGQQTVMKEALLHLDVQTFWGRMKFRKNGFNEGFEMGFAQFQGHDTVPKLIGPASFRETAKAVYPAVWPCNLFDNCDITQGWSLWWVLGALLTGGLCVVLSYACYSRLKKNGILETVREVSFLQRRSVFETHSTESLLRQNNVSGNWYSAATEGAQSLEPSPDSAPPGFHVAFSARRLKHQSSRAAPVLFRDQNVSDLRPRNWRNNTIGKGSYGTVYRATWEGKDVAVKELKIPEDADGLTEREKVQFLQQAKELRDEFLKELKVSCDLNHPNLVRLLGWATHEKCPVVVQEYLAGKSLDHQLYVEKWRPTPEDTLKVALDIASGMEYLHTAFVNSANHTMPVIHRDLKSPNLLLLHAPPDFNSGHGEKQQIWVKIADFGLARNKKLDVGSQTHLMQTGMMTGCGSILWMAPEILLGDTYNEKVDVYSFAMCMVELRNGHLPWQGGKTRVDTTQVPYKVTRGERPTWQLKRNKQGQAKQDFINNLIQECWDQDPKRRPEFGKIVEDVREQYEAARRRVRGHE